MRNVAPAVRRSASLKEVDRAIRRAAAVDKNDKKVRPHGSALTIDGKQDRSEDESQDSFGVMGIGLHAASRERLRAAFPDCLLFGDHPEEQAAARELCRARPRTTVFVDVPASGDLAHQRSSLLFDQARVKIVALCEECTDDMYDAALLYEFSGAIPLRSTVETYRRAAAAVQRGELWFSRDYLSKLTRQYLNSPARLELSEREMSILKLMLENSSNQEIADRLFIARETVRWHLKSLYSKLGVSDRESARQFARNVLFPS